MVRADASSQSSSDEAYDALQNYLLYTKSSYFDVSSTNLEFLHNTLYL